LTTAYRGLTGGGLSGLQNTARAARHVVEECSTERGLVPTHRKHSWRTTLHLVSGYFFFKMKKV